MPDELKTTITDGEVTLKVKLDDLWYLLSDYQKEQILQEQAWWIIVQKALEYEMSESLSNPHFNFSIHNLREIILTNQDFVNRMTVEFIKQLLEEMSHALQHQRAAEKAYWGLYHWVRDNFPQSKIPDGPYDVSKDEPYIRIKSKEVEQDIREYFIRLLKDYS
jgi:hypothetical protein